MTTDQIVSLGPELVAFLTSRLASSLRRRSHTRKQLTAIVRCSVSTTAAMAKNADTAMRTRGFMVASAKSVPRLRRHDTL